MITLDVYKRQLDTVRLTIFEIAKERLDCRQTSIAGSHRIAASLLDVCQKPKYESGIDLSEIDFRRRYAQVPGRKPQ